tara:strand:+ start:730 stop:1038 length:309 start_codon:yes stop_codon:yes gene_type:complete
MTNINELIQNSKARFDHEANRALLKQKYKAKLIFAHNGGLWSAGPELLSVLNCCNTDSVVILDLYDNPIKVNVAALINETHSLWQEQMNAWLIEHESFRKLR